jgi:hypothetical protein
MPYEIIRRTSDLVWVKMHGRLTVEHAECYFQEMWQTLDACPRSTDLLVDGRHIEDAPHAARQRTEQVAHHPHLGHVAFIVSHHHMLLFAPLMRLVSGIGLFGSEPEAVEFLSRERSRPAVGELGLPNMPPRPHQSAAPARDPATQMLRSLTNIVEGWNKSLSQPGDERSRGRPRDH